MPGPVRQLLITCVVAAVWLSPAIGHAWIETRVESSQTALDLTPEGTATVQYQLMLDVRGAPLKGFALDGVDVDAEPLPDATITRMKGGIATSLPLPVQILAAAGRLEITVPAQKRLQRQDVLAEAELSNTPAGPGPDPTSARRAALRARVGGAPLRRWRRFRHAPRPNGGGRARSRDAGRGGGTTDSTANFGIVMSTLRRSQARDELELVRAHVARDEAITWRVLLDRGLFPGAVQVSPTDAASPPPVMPSTAAPLVPARSVALAAGLPWILLASVAYALLIALKSWRLDHAARIRNCRPRPFVAWRARYRATAAGLCLGAAAAAVVWLDAPVSRRVSSWSGRPSPPSALPRRTPSSEDPGNGNRSTPM